MPTVTERIADFLSPLLGEFPVTTEYGAPAALGGGAHWGTDFGAPAGTPVYAVADAKVEGASWNEGGGNLVTLSHAGGISTVYAHLREYIVSSGDMVKKGEIIGYVGSTGKYTTGAHLHFEAKRDGTPFNPLDLFDGLNGGDEAAYQTDKPRRMALQSDGNCPVGYHKRDDGFFGVGASGEAYCERDNILGEAVAGGLDATKAAAVGVVDLFAFIFDPLTWARIFATLGGAVLFLAGLYIVWNAT